MMYSSVIVHSQHLYCRVLFLSISYTLILNYPNCPDSCLKFLKDIPFLLPVFMSRVTCVLSESSFILRLSKCQQGATSEFSTDWNGTQIHCQTISL